ncbi:cytochrome P450 [Streptomyces sp. NBC_01387]|uniref:cytochrome P450 n=1 Tax=unclassified Streptomyces TaxID=2593676 RepID=UPI00202591F5|nr:MULTISPECIES: cytochrome P450 [unclassified Streptomyces]MCX4551515.1 cytochrome P450 [Streptomyces sp. NBC_01500]WSC22900.1 cytochrome P450 [Streptomyces sp. NBC_01766]
MHISGTDRSARTTVFTPRIEALLREHRGAEVFRLDSGTVGVAGPALIDEILRSRPANEFERPTFKPLQGRSITRPESSALMRAVSQDVRAALRKPDPAPVDLSGEWPHVGHTYLRDLIFGSDPFRLRVLMDRKLELTPKLTWTVIGTGAAFPLAGPDAPVSGLAALTAAAASYGDRRHAMGLYRRAAAPVCFTVSALVTNALWLGSPFPDDVSNRDILLESLRLLPPSWNLLRVASPEFAALDDRIGVSDDVLMLPLLTHRDPAIWDDPDAYRPERWTGADPDDHPGYLPFGHANERCWGRHMVMPLAERLLDLLRADGLAVSPEQTSARVPLAGLMGVTGVRVTRR